MGTALVDHLYIGKTQPDRVNAHQHLVGIGFGYIKHLGAIVAADIVHAGTIEVPGPSLLRHGAGQLLIVFK